MPRNTSGGFIHRATHAPVPTAITATTGPTTGSSRLGSGDGMRVKEGNTRQWCAEKGEGGEGAPSLHPPHLVSFQTVSSLMCQHPTPRFHLVKKPAGWAGVAQARDLSYRFGGGQM